MPALVGYGNKPAPNWVRQFAIGMQNENPGFSANPALVAQEPYANKTIDQLLAKNKNPLLHSLYGNLQNALQDKGIYSQNDIRNRGLSIASADNASWLDYMKGANTAAAMEGMGDSGFFNEAVGKAQAAQEAKTTASVADASREMNFANESYKQQRLFDALTALQQWRDIKKKLRLTQQDQANLLANASVDRSNPYAWLGTLGQVGSAVAGYMTGPKS